MFLALRCCPRQRVAGVFTFGGIHGCRRFCRAWHDDVRHSGFGRIVRPPTKQLCTARHQQIALTSIAYREPTPQISLAIFRTRPANVFIEQLCLHAHRHQQFRVNHRSEGLVELHGGFPHTATCPTRHKDTGMRSRGAILGPRPESGRIKCVVP